MNNDWSTPQNELESALMRAATDTAARPAFYKALAESQLLIVPEGEPPPVVDGVVKQGAKLALAQVQIEGQWCTPIFSSEARLPQGARYLGMAALDLLRMTSGSHLILTVKKETKALISQPKDYPHEFVAALKRYFATEPVVKKAFLAQHFIAGVHTEPALVVSILVPDREFDRIAAAVGVIARETRKVQSTVDVTKFQNESDSYFSGQQPIYARKKQGFLAKLFG